MCRERPQLFHHTATRRAPARLPGPAITAASRCDDGEDHHQHFHHQQCQLWEEHLLESHCDLPCPLLPPHLLHQPRPSARNFVARWAWEEQLPGPALPQVLAYQEKEVHSQHLCCARIEGIE